MPYNSVPHTKLESSKENVFTSPWLVTNEHEPPSKGDKTRGTSDGALSMSSRTTQKPFIIAYQDEKQKKY